MIFRNPEKDTVTSRGKRSVDVTIQGEFGFMPFSQLLALYLSHAFQLTWSEVSLSGNDVKHRSESLYPLIYNTSILIHSCTGESPPPHQPSSTAIALPWHSQKTPTHLLCNYNFPHPPSRFRHHGMQTPFSLLTLLPSSTVSLSSNTSLLLTQTLATATTAMTLIHYIFTSIATALFVTFLLLDMFR